MIRHLRLLAAPALITSLLVPTQAIAAMAVADVLGFKQNIGHYINELEAYAMQEGLLSDQLRSMIDSVELATSNLEQVLFAARQLEDLSGYVEDRDLRAIYDATMDMYGIVAGVSPQDPNFEYRVGEIFTERYPSADIPPPYESLRGSSETVARSSESYEALLAERENMLREFANASAQGELSRQRASQVEDYRRELESLGSKENPALATAQLNAKQGNLVLQQNEEIISRLNDGRAERLEEEAEALQFRAQLEIEKRERLQRKSRIINIGSGGRQ